MDDSSLVHPPDHLLRAFGLGQLEAAEAEKVAEHLDACRDCSETMAGLKDDTFVSLVRKSPEALAGQQAEVQATIDSHSGVLGESATLAELPPDLRRHPRYEILDLIGRGGMGDVYKAQHKVMNRTVALKVIRPELVQNAAAVERFQREVQAAARLHHTNIVTAYDAEQAGDVHFLVMEFVDGTDLSQVIHERGPLPITEACDYIRQAAVGLEHARQLGMVHRDIKPHNLMLTGEGQIKILDFGLANFANDVLSDEAGNDTPTGAHTTFRARHQLTQMGTMMGTPDYIAPEQAVDARTADIRSDIYSLGCTLSFLLTGKPLFNGTSVTDKLKAHAEQRPPKLTDSRGDFPPELQQVVNRMLAKDPSQRFQTPFEVATALEPFGRPAVALPHKRSLRQILTAAAAILLAGVIYITTDQGRIEIRTDVDDVDVVVSRGGEEVKTIDLATESQVTWMPSGDYTISLKQDRNDIQITPNGFRLSRWGKQIVNLTRLPETAARDHERIQGEWVAEAGERNGQPLPVDQIRLQRAVFDGDTLRVDMPGGVKGEGHFQLTETASPRQIGIFVAGENKGMRGIYKLEGDRLTLGMDQNTTGNLPTRFAAPAGTTIDVVVMRRVSGARGAAAAFDNATTTRGDLAEVKAYLNDPRNNRGGSVPVALLGQNGRVAFRFGNWLVIFEGIACDPKATLLGFSNFNIPHRGSSGEGTIDFGAGDKLPGVLIKYKFADEQNEISINNFRLKLRGKATRLEFDDRTYDATNSVQTILVARDGSTRPPVADPAQGLPSAVVDHMLLQGLWIAVSGHAGGQPIPAEQLPKFSIKIDQDQVTIAPPGAQSQEQRGTFKVSTTGTPRQIDIVVADKKAPMAGIYEVDQQRLKLALVDGDSARPTGFSPSDRPGHIIGIFERAPYTGISEYVEFKHAGLNGSFEITRYGLPVNWHMSTPKRAQGSDFDILMDTTDFKEGKQSLKFVVRKCDEKRGPGFFKEFAPNQNPPAAFETKPGETYKVSFWAKSAGSEFVFRARGVSAFGGDEGAIIRSKETFDEWRRFECTTTLPSKMWLRVNLSVVRPGTLWIDDLQIVKVNDARLQGSWIAVSGLARKQPIPAEQLAKFSITFDGEQVTITQPGNPPVVQRGTFKSDESRTPKRIDFIAADKKETMPGIYEFDGEQLKLAVVDGDYARPTTFDSEDRADHMTLVFKRVPLRETLGDEETKVLKAAEAFLAVMDEGRFGQLFDMGSMLAKRQSTRDKTSQIHQQLRDTAGKIEQRTLQRVRLMDEFIGLPPRRYAAVVYRSDSEKHKGLWETVLLNVDDDGMWRANTYNLMVEPMPLPEPTKAPAADQKQSDDPKKAAATAAAREWLELVDAGKFAECWEGCAAFAKSQITKEQVAEAYEGRSLLASFKTIAP